jgi:hypothetical protein
MQRHELVRKVRSKTQVRSSTGSSKDTHSCRSSGTLAPGRGKAQATAMSGEFEQIRGRLEAIAEELSELAIERLRESIDAGGNELPVDERRLTRARRAVEKAINLLDEPDDAD